MGRLLIPVVRLVYLMAFIMLGLGAWREMQLHRMITDGQGDLGAALTPMSTTDRYIRELLIQDGAPASAVAQPAAAIQTALAELPPEGSLIFVTPRNSPTNDLMFLVLKTLSLPRSTYWVWCEGSSPPGPPANEKIAAVVFYLVTPPTDVRGSKLVIPRLSIAPVSDVVAWTSYCSR